MWGLRLGAECQIAGRQGWLLAGCADQGRLCHRYYNLWERYKAFRYEPFQEAVDMISRGSFLRTTDLKSDY